MSEHRNRCPGGELIIETQKKHSSWTSFEARPRVALDDLSVPLVPYSRKTYAEMVPIVTDRHGASEPLLAVVAGLDRAGRPGARGETDETGRRDDGR